MEKVEGYSLCRLNEDHMLLPLVQALFDEELHVLENVDGLVRQAASERRLVTRVSVEPGLKTDWEVLLTTRHRFDWRDEKWLRDLEDDLRRRSGLDLAVTPRSPESLARDSFFRDLN